MYPLKRFLVCLDLSPMDKTLLEYIGGLTGHTPDAKIYFIHVSKRFEVPEELKKTYPGITGPADEIIENEIENSVNSYFTPLAPATTEIVIKDGNTTEQILKWAKVKEIDLIVMGQKNRLKGSGSSPGKITSVCSSSVLFIPENSQCKLKKILVPTDFSENSAMALETAFGFQKQNNCEVLVQSVYRVPTGYHYTGKEYSEFAVIMRKNAEKDMDVFLKKHNISKEDVRILFSIDDDDKPADVIYEEAQAQHADLIILGSRGRTAAAAFLLGSVAVNLLQHNKTTPYMIVKDKKSNMSFIEAFKNL